MCGLVAHSEGFKEASIHWKGPSTVGFRSQFDLVATLAFSDICLSLEEHLTIPVHMLIERLLIGVSKSRPSGSQHIRHPLLTIQTSKDCRFPWVVSSDWSLGLFLSGRLIHPALETCAGIGTSIVDRAALDFEPSLSFTESYNLEGLGIRLINGPRGGRHAASTPIDISKVVQKGGASPALPLLGDDL